MMQTSRRIPHVQSPPWIGSALSAASDAPAFLLREYRKLGPVYRFSAFGKKVLVLAGREANLFASKEGAAHFSSKECWEGLNKAYGTKETLISRDGASHRAMRKLQKDGYSRNRMADKMPELVDMTREELMRHQGRKVSVQWLLQRVVSLQLGYLTMGAQRFDRLDDMCHFLRTTLACTVTEQRPKILLKSPRYLRARSRALAFARELLEQVDPTQDHLLADLIKAHHEDPEGLPKSELLSYCLAPFAAGLDTAASTLAFCCYHLSQSSEISAEIQQQSDAYFEQAPTLRGLTQSDCAYATLLETLRYNPIAPALARTSRDAFDFMGYRIPKGESIVLATTVTHHDERYFPNPELFDINRYRGSQGQHRQAGAYVPFGVGPHVCLGAGMAQALMLLNLQILSNAFDLRFEGLRKGLSVYRVPTVRPSPTFRVTLLPRSKRVRVFTPSEPAEPAPLKTAA